MTSKTDTIAEFPATSPEGALQGGVEKSLRSLLRTLLETGGVDAVFALRKTELAGKFCYSLVSDPDLVDSFVVPFFPLMPVQGARALASLTGIEPLRKKVAALLRPCELRACIELQKQSQLSLENIQVISCTCPGVFPASSMAGDRSDEFLSGYGDAVSSGTISDGVRDACRYCTAFTPSTPVAMTAVITSDRDSDAGVICLHSEWAVEVAGGLANTTDLAQEDICSLVSGLQKLRSEQRERIMSTSAFDDGLDGMVSLFAKCTGCGGCRAACPVCHCVLCDYESANRDLTRKVLDAELSRKGALRIPAGTIRFHLGRLNHISSYCVSCGQCTDACPVGIPVADIFIRVGNSVQEKLGYATGTVEDEEPSLATYREIELEDITDR